MLAYGVIAEKPRGKCGESLWWLIKNNLMANPLKHASPPYMLPRRILSNYVSISRGEPQNWGASGPRPNWEGRRGWPPKNKPLPNRYHVECGRSVSNGVGVRGPRNCGAMGPCPLDMGRGWPALEIFVTWMLTRDLFAVEAALYWVPFELDVADTSIGEVQINILSLWNIDR